MPCRVYVQCCSVKHIVCILETVRWMLLSCKVFLKVWNLHCLHTCLLASSHLNPYFYPKMFTILYYTKYDNIKKKTADSSLCIFFTFMYLGVFHWAYPFQVTHSHLEAFQIHTVIHKLFITWCIKVQTKWKKKLNRPAHGEAWINVWPLDVLQCSFTCVTICWCYKHNVMCSIFVLWGSLYLIHINIE